MFPIIQVYTGFPWKYLNIKIALCRRSIWQSIFKILCSGSNKMSSVQCSLNSVSFELQINRMVACFKTVGKRVPCGSLTTSLWHSWRSKQKAHLNLALLFIHLTLVPFNPWPGLLCWIEDLSATIPCCLKCWKYELSTRKLNLEDLEESRWIFPCLWQT